LFLVLLASLLSQQGEIITLPDIVKRFEKLYIREIQGLDTAL
jgi:hypothetical protein